MFKKKKQKERQEQHKFVVTEGIESHWNYHISRIDNQKISLCGVPTMYSHATFATWGHKSDHIPESYCHECVKRYALSHGDIV